MRFRTWNDVEAAGYTGACGPLFRIDTVVFDDYVDDDGATRCLDAEFWYDERIGVWVHWFDCFFTDLDEARLWCSLFDGRTARWTLGHGNGRDFDNVALDVMRMEWDEWSDEWVPGYAVSTYDWLDGVRLEEWHDLDVSGDRACRV